MNHHEDCLCDECMAAELVNADEEGDFYAMQCAREKQRTLEKMNGLY